MVGLIWLSNSLVLWRCFCYKWKPLSKNVGSGSPATPKKEARKIKPYEIVMLIILLALEIPAATFLVVAWVRACRETKNRSAEDGK